MNREKEDQLPLMQVGFIDSICMPIYEVNCFCCLISVSQTFALHFSPHNKGEIGVSCKKLGSGCLPV